jgi:bifunctional DNase/RNase
LKVVKARIFDIVMALTPVGMAYTIILEDEAKRMLPIFVNEVQAYSIKLVLANLKPAIPTTHDFLIELIKSLKVNVKKALIHAISPENRFSSNITFEAKGKAITVEGSPSDTIALAIRANAPIYVAAKVMEQASVDRSRLLKNIGKGLLR